MRSGGLIGSKDGREWEIVDKLKCTHISVHHWPSDPKPHYPEVINRNPPDPGGFDPGAKWPEKRAPQD